VREPDTAPNTVDARDRADLLRIVVYFGPPCFVLLSALWSFWYSKGYISAGVLVVLLILNLPLTAAGVMVINRMVAKASTGLVRTMFAAGDIPPPRSYPRQDVLIARGQYAEAAEYFRDHLRITPEDNEARLRLADLLERHLNDPEEVERLYWEIRRTSPTGREEMAAANGLIDLYRRTARRDRLLVELARFAERYQGTSAAEAAGRELRELKAAGS